MRILNVKPQQPGNPKRSARISPHVGRECSKSCNILAAACAHGMLPQSSAQFSVFLCASNHELSDPSPTYDSRHWTPHAGLKKLAWKQLSSPRLKKKAGRRKLPLVTAPVASRRMPGPDPAKEQSAKSVALYSFGFWHASICSWEKLRRDQLQKKKEVESGSKPFLC